METIFYDTFWTFFLLLIVDNQFGDKKDFEKWFFKNLYVKKFSKLELLPSKKAATSWVTKLETEKSEPCLIKIKKEVLIRITKVSTIILIFISFFPILLPLSWFFSTRIGNMFCAETAFEFYIFLMIVSHKNLCF